MECLAHLDQSDEKVKPALQYLREILRHLDAHQSKEILAHKQWLRLRSKLTGPSDSSLDLATDERATPVTQVHQVQQPEACEDVASGHPTRMKRKKPTPDRPRGSKASNWRKCEHGKSHGKCPTCNPCPHGEAKGLCKVCNGCAHGRVRGKCRICNGCPHGRWKNECLQCSCPHGKAAIQCEKCNGCPHGRRKYNCRLCNGCLHGKLKYFCSACCGCPHGRLKRNCKDCRDLQSSSRQLQSSSAQSLPESRSRCSGGCWLDKDLSHCTFALSVNSK